MGNHASVKSMSLKLHPFPVLCGWSESSQIIISLSILDLFCNRKRFRNKYSIANLNSPRPLEKPSRTINWKFQWLFLFLSTSGSDFREQSIVPGANSGTNSLKITGEGDRGNSQWMSDWARTSTQNIWISTQFRCRTIPEVVLWWRTFVMEWLKCMFSSVLLENMRSNHFVTLEHFWSRSCEIPEWTVTGWLW
jgi:hypothetical protein